MIDKSNMKKVLSEYPLQIRKGIDLAGSRSITRPFDSIVVCGMGGSALPGLVLQGYLAGIRDFSKPIQVVREYVLPPTVTKDSLVFVISYSGNTEETISAYREAIKLGAQVFVITSGGKLAELCGMNETELVQIPSGLQPRAAIGYMLAPLLMILSNSNAIPQQRAQLERLARALEHEKYSKMGQEIAQRLVGFVPLIYTSGRYACVGYKWKIMFNECSKVHAFWNVFSELNHNEMVGYTSLKAKYYTILIGDEDEHPRIKKRFNITKRLIKEKGVDVLELGIKGESWLIKLFSAIYIGDWTSYHLALIYEVDPSEVHIVEDLKKELAE